MTSGASTLPADGARRRFLATLYRHVPAQLLILLAPPVGWFGAIYLGSLAILLLSAFWYLDPITSAVVHQFSLANFQQLIDDPVNRVIVLRTVTIAAGGDRRGHGPGLPDRLLHGPGGVAQARSVLFMAVLLPLWSNYLVRVFAWRVILANGGPLDGLLGVVGLAGPGLHRRVDLARLHLPLAAVHDPAHLRRASNGSRAPCWRPRPTSAARAGRRSGGSSCRSSCRPSQPARSSPSR